MPYLRAQATICFALAPSFTPPRPDFAEQLDARCGELLEVLLDHARLDDRRAGVQLDAADAEARNVRCAKMACAFRPTMSRGRPG